MTMPRKGVPGGVSLLAHLIFIISLITQVIGDSMRSAFCSRKRTVWAIAYYSRTAGENLKKQVDKTMREIQVAEHKTLKLTNVLARKIEDSELGNLSIVLTQMQNFIRSRNAMPVGPLVQCVKMHPGPNPTAEIYFMQQVNQLIPRLDPGYQMDAVLRVRNCLYAHYTGPMSHSNLASQKLDIYAFEHELKLTGDVYSIYVNQDEDDGVLDVFMETK